LAGNIRKILDACVFSFGHLALKLSLHYLVKCSGHSATDETANRCFCNDKHFTAL